MRKFLFVLLLIALILPLPKAWALSEEEHPLFQYINKPDPAYSWEKVKEEKMVGGEKFISIKMVSQIWQGIKWEHELDVIVPAKLDNGSVVGLLITGDRDEQLLNILRLLANKVGIPMAVMLCINSKFLLD
jgi:hypothetical protein